MMKKKIIATLVLISFGSFVTVAHEFWVSPSKFFASPGETISLVAMVGENYEGERWGGEERRFTGFEVHTAHGVSNKTHTIQQDSLSVSLPDIGFEEEGTHLLVFTTNSSFIGLKPEEFLAYLEEDGLDNAINYRKKNNEEDKPGRELYRRCAKVLVQVGGRTDETFRKNTGMPLEIIPVSNPYALRGAGKLAFKVLYKNKPLQNALVRCWYKSDLTGVNMVRSNENGIAEFEINGSGDYMISVVTMERLANESADWQSTWGSLVFGISLEKQK